MHPQFNGFCPQAKYLDAMFPRPYNASNYIRNSKNNVPETLRASGTTPLSYERMKIVPSRADSRSGTIRSS